jgi:hypothetical protein
MKKKILLLILLFGACTYAQTEPEPPVETEPPIEEPTVPKILFEYDAAGNQIKRELCINCPIFIGRQRSAKETVTTQPQKFLPEDRLSYYPNPVKEALTIQWGKEDNGHIQKIVVYTIDGRQMSSVTNLKSANMQTVPFLDFPSGVYVVVVHFDNKEQEAVKIIKK